MRFKQLSFTGSPYGDKELQGAPEAEQYEYDGDHEEACLHVYHTRLHHRVPHLTSGLGRGGGK